MCEKGIDQTNYLWFWNTSLLWLLSSVNGELVQWMYLKIGLP